MLENEFKIETNRTYDMSNNYDKELIKDPFFKDIQCVDKSCYMHLDYELNIEDEVWESKMVRIHQSLKLLNQCW